MPFSGLDTFVDTSSLFAAQVGRCRASHNLRVVCSQKCRGQHIRRAFGGHARGDAGEEARQVATPEDRFHGTERGVRRLAIPLIEHICGQVHAISGPIQRSEGLQKCLHFAGKGILRHVGAISKSEIAVT